MAYYYSNEITTGTYVRSRIAVNEYSVNVINNTSDLQVWLEMRRTNTGFTTSGKAGWRFTVNGSSQNDSANVSISGTNWVRVSGIKTFTGIGHNTDGSKTVAVTVETTEYSGISNLNTPKTTFNVTLTKIDRAAPTVNISTSGITASSVILSVTASTTCNRWDYSINGGSSWVNFSTSSGTSASKTITGLTPNTSYTLRARARKSSNQVYGASGNLVIKTLGGSALTSVNTLTADDATVKLTFSATVYNTSYKHTLIIKDGQSAVLTFTNLSLVSGSNTVTLTSAQRSALLNAMSAKKSFTGTFVLKSFGGSTQIGTDSSRTAAVQTTAANSAPAFTGFTYKDSNNKTVEITANDQLFIQDYSILTVKANVATAKNGASISQYEATINGTTVKSSDTALILGTIAKPGTLQLSVRAIDSRGYPVEVNKDITVIPYSKISIANVSMRRVNEVEAITQVDFEADISKISVSGENKNTLCNLYYRYKKTSEDVFGELTDVSDQAELTYSKVVFQSDEFVSLDPEFSYNIEFIVYDKLSSYSYSVVLPQGIPLVSYRRKKIGVNNRNPQAGLDVNGGLIVDGIPYDNVVVESGTSGIWTYRKWSDGTAECWGSTWVNKQGLSKYDVLYYSEFIEVPLPTNVFKAVSTVNLCISDPWLLVNAIGHNNGNVRFKLVSNTAYSSMVSVNPQMYITGRWK